VECRPRTGDATADDENIAVVVRVLVPTRAALRRHMPEVGEPTDHGLIGVPLERG
jgi:hypothetical protein